MTRFTTPTDTDGNGRLNDSETAAALDAGMLIAKPFKVKEDGTKALVYIGPDGEPHVIDLVDALADHQQYPARKSGTFKAHDAESFVAYLAKHKLGQTEVWSDAQKQEIVGVINAHSGVFHEGGVEDEAGWGDHRVVLGVKLTDAWKAWATHDGKLLDQSVFAEHIEDRLVDIRVPDAADLLELAESFQASTSLRFESQKLLASGQRQFQYVEETNATAGKTGQLEIPKEFELGLQPFEGSDPVIITARLRFRLRNGSLALGYKLNRPEDVLRDAFTSVSDAIKAGVGDTPVYLGSTG